MSLSDLKEAIQQHPLIVFFSQPDALNVELNSSFEA
jgi:hypothetical protein